MSSQSRTNEYPHASAILSGLGLVAQLTAAATDGIPVAKLIVGVVSRILTLAEAIEKRRTALHALAETARITGESIRDVLDHREPGAQIERSLEGLHTVFRAIEALFAKHKAKNAFFRALSYALTTAAHIDALSQELSRAAQQFAVVATLDTHARVQEANTRLQETNDRLEDAKADIRELQIRLQQNSVYNGHFRNLHDCDVDILEFITEDAPPWRRHSIKYYTARVETSRSIMVLRYIEPNARFNSEAYSDDADYTLQEVARHDRLLKKFSKIQHSHQNIARIYGVCQEGPLTRFIVMKSGYTPFCVQKRQTLSVYQAWNLIIQLLDAACYLNDNGVSWKPDLSNPFFLDTADMPIIGLHNDFGPSMEYSGAFFVFQNMLEHAYAAHWEQCRPSKHALDIIFGDALVPNGLYGKKITVPRRLIPKLNARMSMYITSALQSLEDAFDVWARTGAVILHASASRCTVGSAFYTKYSANFLGSPFRDHIFLARVDESETELVHWTVSADVPKSMAETLRKKLGITMEGPPDHMDILESYKDPAEPARMRFTSQYPRGSA